MGLIPMFLLLDLEREGQYGVTQNVDPQNNCLQLQRTIVDLENYVSYPQAAKFIDVTYDVLDKKWKVEEDCRTALDAFKNQTLRRWLPEPNNAASFEILWKFEDGVDVKQHAEYVTEMCTAFHNKMKSLVDRVAHAQRSETLPPLLVEVMAHWQESQRHLDGFVGRRDALNVLRQYVTSNDTKPLVITGPPGAGKTALLSKAAAEVWSFLVYVHSLSIERPHSALTYNAI